MQIKGLFLLIVSFSVLFIGACQTQQAHRTQPFEEKLLTPQQVREDFAYIEKYIKRVHPEPFKRLSAEKYHFLNKRLRENLFWPMTERESYIAFSKIIHQFRDHHLKLDISPTLINTYIQGGGGFFPLAILINNDCWVVKDLQDKPVVPIGAKLLSIDNQPIEWIIKELKSIISWETVASTSRLIQTDFSKLYWLRFQSKTNDFTIEYQWQGKQFSKTIFAIQPEISDVDEQQIESYYGAQSLNEMTEILWFNDFNEKTVVFETFLRETFERLKKTSKQNLIIDLRYNAGGISENAGLLLSYLSGGSHFWAKQYQIKISKVFERFHSKNITAVKEQKLWASFAWLPIEFLEGISWEILMARQGELVIQQQAKRESNQTQTYNVVVLTNGHCLSACAALVAKIKEYRVGVIIGEGVGSFVQEQYVYPLQVTLPHSKMILHIPTTKAVFVEEGEMGLPILTGVEPDIFSTRSDNDIASNIDRSMRKAISLLNYQSANR